MKIIKSSFSILLAFYISVLSAQDYTYTIDTTRSGQEMLFGEVSPQAFTKAPFSS